MSAESPGPAPATPRDGEARLETLAGYLRANREKYTPESLGRAAREAGFTDAEIEAAFERAGGNATVVGAPQRAQARALVVAVYAVTFLGFAVLMLSKPSAMQYGWGFALIILAVALGLSLLLSLWTIGRATPTAATASGAIASMVAMPVVLLLVLAGLCVMTTAPVGLLR
jgi:hypothetical protein